MTTAHIGKAVSRVDGRAKVTGEAKYAGEYNVPNLAFGYVVSSEVARGKITRIDASGALALPGVLRVFTHENRPPVAESDNSYQDFCGSPGAPFRPFQDDEIKYSGQPIALVVAENFELARFAASLVRVDYEVETHATDLEEQRSSAYRPRPRAIIPPPPDPRGDADEAFANAATKLEAEYRVPVEHHNPMEPFATTALHDGNGKLIVYDKTQGVQNVRDYLCNVFGYAKDDLHVVARFVGGAFGSGLRPVYTVFLAVLAARELKRPVRVSLTRQQMFTFWHRPATWQRVALGARTDGALEALIHEAVSETSRFEDYSEPVVHWSPLLYRCENVRVDQKVAQLDLPTPGDMRAPGAAWGVFAIECAMDELAVKLGIDPLELRLKNYTERDQDGNKPFSSKELRACYRQAAEKFGWMKRSPAPRSMRRGSTLVGWGMASGIWEAFVLQARAKAVLTADGKLTVASATEDIGTGTYTIMTQIAAESLGLPMESVTFQLGDSSLPEAPIEGGSFTAATVGSAVKAVCQKIQEKVFHAAQQMDNSPLAGAGFEEVTFAGEQIQLSRDPARAVSIVEAMRRAKLDAIREEAIAEPLKEREQYSCNAHSAIFVEVRIDADLGTIQVTRVVSAVAGGRILNPKTARSQLAGGIVWGIGMALEEESAIDQTLGRFVNHNLAEYHVPVNADVNDIEVIFVEEKDDIVNPLGAKGLGEIGVVGVAPAIANAVFHATGKRIRELPITLEKLL
jgi:xanthine dehydrogenase YagR molybdenum-binding subunit